MRGRGRGARQRESLDISSDTPRHATDKSQRRVASAGSAENSKPSRSSDDQGDGRLGGNSWQDATALSTVPEQELRTRLQAAQAEEAALHAEEDRLRQELQGAQSARDHARRREIQARESCDDARRRDAHLIERLRSDLADLKKLLQEHEQTNLANFRDEQAWQAEIDAKILAQADAIAKRDKLAEELSHVEERARADGVLVSKSEARASHLEEKVKKERERIDAVRRETEVLRRETEDENRLQRHAEEELRQCQQSETHSLRPTQAVFFILLLAVIVSLVVRAWQPASSELTYY